VVFQYYPVSAVNYVSALCTWQMKRIILIRDLRLCMAFTVMCNLIQIIPYSLYKYLYLLFLLSTKGKCCVFAFCPPVHISLWRSTMVVILKC
jgi:hypothetical protein